MLCHRSPCNLGWGLAERPLGFSFTPRHKLSIWLPQLKVLTTTLQARKESYFCIVMEGLRTAQP